MRTLQVGQQPRLQQRLQLPACGSDTNKLFTLLHSPHLNESERVERTERMAGRKQRKTEREGVGEAPSSNIYGSTVSRAGIRSCRFNKPYYSVLQSEAGHHSGRGCLGFQKTREGKRPGAQLMASLAPTKSLSRETVG